MSLKKMFSTLSREKKAAIVFVFASALSSGLNIITTPLFTRLMPIEQYGLVSLYNSWYQVLYVFASFSVINQVANVGFYNYPKDRYGFLSSALGITTLCSVMVSAVLLVFRKPFLKTLGLDASILVLMILSFIGLTALNIWIVLQKYELKYKIAFVIMLSTSIASTGLALVLVKVAEDNHATVKLWSTNILHIIVGFVFFVIIIGRGKKFFNKEYWKFILLYNGPLLLHYLSQFVLSGSDRIMIDVFEGEAKVAIYSLAYSLASMLTIVWYPFNSTLIPYMHKCVREDNTTDLADCIYNVLTIVGGLCVVVSLLTPEAFFILGDVEYAEGIYVVPVVVVGVFFTVFYNLIANVEFLFGKTHRIALMTIAAAVINIVLNGVFIPIFGYIAAAYTTLIAYMVYAMLHYYNTLKRYKRFLSGIKLIGILGAVMTICLCISLLYENYLIRYILASVCIIWLLTKVKKYFGR